MGLNKQLIEACASVIAEKAEYLTSLDQAIGDGDHGINMNRGFQALAAQADALDDLSHGEALIKAGMILVSHVGGASGPLYGTLFMNLGKAMKAGGGFDEQFQQALDAVKRRGKSEPGAKTMLDVLTPIAQALKSADDNGRFKAVRQSADQGLEATRDMIATRGRASFLGERSKGHLDPGASSAVLLTHAVIDVLEAKS